MFMEPMPISLFNAYGFFPFSFRWLLLLCLFVCLFSSLFGYPNLILDQTAWCENKTAKETDCSQKKLMDQYSGMIGTEYLYFTIDNSLARNANYIIYQLVFIFIFLLSVLLLKQKLSKEIGSNLFCLWLGVFFLSFWIHGSSSSSDRQIWT